MLRRLRQSIRQSIRQVLFLMARRPDVVCGAVVLSVLLVIAIKLTCSHAKNVVASARPPVRFFSNQAPVVDLYLGQLDQVERLRGVAEVSLIFFYAPWCAHSLAARQEVHQVARKLAKQVQFLAVNCWWSQGKCRKQNRLFQYPVIHLFYKRFGPIEYKGPLVAAYLENFILRVLTPLVYLPSRATLKEFLSYHEPGVVGFFQFSSSPQPPGYITYLFAALQALKSDFRGLVRFGVVTSREVAESISITEDQTVYLHRRFNSSLTYPLRHRNHTVALASALCRWVFDHGETVLQWLQPPGTKSRLLEQELTRGPALLVFLQHDPLGPAPRPLLEVADVALRYHSCAAKHTAGSPLLCCHTVAVGGTAGGTGLCDLCLQEATSCAFPSAATVGRCCPAGPLATACVSAESSYSPLGVYSACRRPAAPANGEQAWSPRTREQSPSSVSAGEAPPPPDVFAGLQCRTNKTLRFYVLDAALTWPLATRLGAPGNALGAGGAFAAIVSLRDEVHYVMRPDAAGLTRSLEAFVQNFSAPYSLLQRHLVGEEGPRGVWEGEPRPRPLITELTTSTFLPSIMDAHMDVLLFYYTQWCGFCPMFNHIIIQLAKLFHGNSTVVVARVNVARNDLPWEFMVDHVPSILLFPKYRKDMSVKFPSNTPITLPNLLRFILKHVSPAPTDRGSATAADGGDAAPQLRALRAEVRARHAARGLLLERLALLGRPSRSLTSDQQAALRQDRRSVQGRWRDEGQRLRLAARRLQELVGPPAASDPLLGESALLGVLLRTLGEEGGEEEEEEEE